VKLQVVGPGKSGIWRRERIRMTEQELDDVAFLTGWKFRPWECDFEIELWNFNVFLSSFSSSSGAENSNGRPPRDRNVAVCSQKRALLVTATVLGALLAIALLIAYAGPQDCPCAGKMPKGYVLDGYNSSEKFEPFATNGQPFPWLLPFLPSNIRPNRYTILIHPNLTTFEVKGKFGNERDAA
jgi:hypothetical protein